MTYSKRIRKKSRELQLKWAMASLGPTLPRTDCRSLSELRDCPDAARRLLKTDPSRWDSGNLLHWAEIVEGQLAFDAGDVEAACAHLRASGRSVDSPQLGSFGPDLELAQCLLDVGRTDEVRCYLEDCRDFWRAGMPFLEEWLAALAVGEVPQVHLRGIF